MGLTQKSEQRLQKVGLIGVFDGTRERWKGFAENAHTFISENFPNGAIIRRDDVAEALVPVLEVDPALQAFLSSKKLKERYWVRYFVDLILERCWEEITNPPQNGGVAQ